MNGSRSNNPHGGKPSLDQLNRTIEGLEARIHGLMGERQRPVSQAAAPVDAILERQRMLGTARDRVASVMERPRTEPSRMDAYRHEPAYDAPPTVAPDTAWERPAPRVAAPDPALSEIAATLGALRQDLRQGLSSDLREGLGEIRNEMHGLKSLAPGEGIESLRTDLAYLGASIDRLENNNRSADTGHLRADLDELRTMLSHVARDDSVRSLEARVAGTERAVASFEPEALREELVQLAWRIDGIKSGLGELSAGPAVRALEEKLLAVAGAVEAVGRNMQSQGGIAEHFAGLDQRLDEITRAIAASARPAGSVYDGSTLARLETRIDDLVDHIAAMPQTNPADELNDRIELLAARIEELASEEAARKLEDRITQLSGLIERNFRETAAPSAFADHLEDISRKIDGLGGAPTSDLIARLDMLSRKMDEIEIPQAAAPVAAPTDMVAMSRLETRLVDIAARLDESAAAPATDAMALQNLERQIANLSALLNQTGPTTVSAGGFPEALGERLNAIEDYMASSDEFIVEAARQAAETVVEAYSRNGFAAHGASASEISALAGLAEDLRMLEAHTRSSEERTHATFGALHETLVQIAGRLDELGHSGPAAAVARAAEPAAAVEPMRMTPERPRDSVSMPKASQPDFTGIDLLAQDPAPRRVPENSKVEVLDEAELMADVEMPVEAVTADAAPVAKAAAPKASKSLIAGLAAKLKPSRKVNAADDGKRMAVDPAPALDPGEAVVEAEPTMLLEPGAGVPDVKKILERVRNGQQSGRRDDAGTGTSDVIAAARRAAQAAAAEAGAQKLVQPSAFKKDKDKKLSKLAGSGESAVRRPILLAAAAVLLVVMSYPLVSNLIGGRSSEEPAPETIQERSVTPPVEDSSAAPDTSEMDVATTDAIAPTATDETVEATDPVDATATDTTATVTETAADTIMEPAQSTNLATTFQKPASTAADVSSDVATADDAPVTMTDTRTSDTAAAEETQPEQATVDAATVDSAEIALPAGLQPASLAEAARKGDALALFEVGARYTDGRGVKADLAEAAKWYQLAAERGLAPAEYRLANFYEKGTGVVRDLEKAKALYSSAASKGNASAMHNLAVLHATGLGGAPDFAEAATWFKAAADLNVRDSQFNLAILYARGNGVAQDLEETYKWFAIAAREGDQDAAQKRDEVANALSPEQLKSAKAKLDLWKPQPLDDAANTPIVPDEWVAKGQTTASVDMKRAIRNIQAILNLNGFDAGKADGEMGKKTVAAIKAFQTSIGQEPTGRIDDALVKELLKRNKKA
ncbi:MAG: SEL1-like repeat protein [Rhizobium sp.]|nr:SEL1-like repeat protein [Rhizobium sp.]